MPVPPGTVVRDRDNGGIVIGELKQPGERLMVAKGGIGGRGNAATKVCMDSHGIFPVGVGVALVRTGHIPHGVILEGVPMGRS